MPTLTSREGATPSVEQHQSVWEKRTNLLIAQVDNSNTIPYERSIVLESEESSSENTCRCHYSSHQNIADDPGV